MKQTEKIREASQIRGQYDYMDKLSLHGWAWEFVRRNNQYMQAFSELEKLVKVGIWNKKCEKTLSELQNVAAPAGLIIDRVSSIAWIGKGKNFLTFKLPPYKGSKASFNKYFGDKHHVGVVPKPGKRYCDFSNKPFYRPQIPDYDIFNTFDEVRNLPPIFSDNNDFFYIAVSKNANIADLKEYMLTDVARILYKHKPRIRQRSKWKYYIIVYDLKQKFNDKISYNDISTILKEAYTDDETGYFDDTRNLENWYDNATSLINGGFIKHLKYKIKSSTK